MVDVAIPVDGEAAVALQNPARLEAAGRYLSSLLKGRHASEALAEALADAKREACARGLTDDAVDAELQDWPAEPDA